MLRALLVAATIVIPIATTSVVAQEKLPPAAQAEVTLVGLPVYSSDGQKLGDITEVGSSRGQPAVRAEIGEFMGLGSTPVVIPANIFKRKGDRVEIRMTADEVKDTISKQHQQPQQPKQ